jgi:hypothetical protein
MLHMYLTGRVAQSVWRLGTDWTVRGSNPGGGEIFHTCPDRSWGSGAHPASCRMGTGSFPGDEERLGRDAEPSPTSSAVVMKGYSYTSTLLMGHKVCTEPQCLYKGALYFLHMYFSR